MILPAKAAGTGRGNDGFPHWILAFDRPALRAVFWWTRVSSTLLPMKQKAVKIGITTVVLVLALTGLLYSTLSEGTEYYLHVEEVMANPSQWQGKNLQLHGFVVKDSILRKRDSLEYKFKVQSKRQFRFPIPSCRFPVPGRVPSRSRFTVPCSRPPSTIVYPPSFP